MSRGTTNYNDCSCSETGDGPWALCNVPTFTYSGTISAEANGKTFTMDCSTENPNGNEVGRVIDVMHATYGPNCNVETNNILNDVKAQCNNQITCNYEVTATVDPLCVKSFYYEYWCGMYNIYIYIYMYTLLIHNTKYIN